MLNKLVNLFKKPEPIPEVSIEEPIQDTVPEPTPPEEPVLSEKEQATANNEPYINIVLAEVDPNNINAGTFELDWNDKFVLNLVRAGYQIKKEDTDADIVDRWFQTICRNIALEIYEQDMADPRNRMEDDLRRIQRKDLGNGRSEIS